MGSEAPLRWTLFSWGTSMTSKRALVGACLLALLAVGPACRSPLDTGVVAETATGDVPMVPFGAIRFAANAFVLEAAPATALRTATRIFAVRVRSSGILSSRARVW